MERLNDVLKSKAQRIKYVFADVDGTLTDGFVYYSPKGELLKKFSLRDGSGFFLLHQAGIKTGIITGEDSPIVAQRAKKLKVDKLLMSAVPKVETLRQELSKEGLTLEDVAFIGDGINDVKLLQSVGIGFAVADAHELAKEAANVILENKGGNGVFLEASEKLIEAKGLSVKEIIEQKL